MGTGTGRLQVHEDLEFQRREWRFQRAGWWGLSAFVLAALLGVFGGSGPLSTATAAAADGSLRIDYQRFVRLGSETRLVVRAQEPPQGAGLELSLDRRYFDALRVERIAPEPVDVVIAPSVVTLRFASAGTGPLTIVMDARLDGVGSHAATVHTAGGAPVSLRQVAYF